MRRKENGDWIPKNTDMESTEPFESNSYWVEGKCPYCGGQDFIYGQLKSSRKIYFHQDGQNIGKDIHDAYISSDSINARVCKECKNMSLFILGMDDEKADKEKEKKYFDINI